MKEDKEVRKLTEKEIEGLEAEIEKLKESSERIKQNLIKKFPRFTKTINAIFQSEQ